MLYKTAQSLSRIAKLFTKLPFKKPARITRQDDGFYHVYCDASKAKNKLSYAWVIATNEVKSPIVESDLCDEEAIIKLGQASIGV